MACHLYQQIFKFFLAILITVSLSVAWTAVMSSAFQLDFAQQITYYLT